MKLKKEYYPKYKDLYRKIDLDSKEEKKYIEGYVDGQLSARKISSGKSLDVDNQEKTLLKEAFKLLAKNIIRM